MIKQILIVILILIIVIAVGTGIYLYFYAPQTVPLLTEEGGGRTFNPFGFFSGDRPDSEGGETKNGDQGGVDTDEGGAEERVVLRQITSVPVSGATILTLSGNTVIRYVERETGHVYDFFATSSERIRRSNTTLPGAEEVIFVGSESIVYRYLDDDGESIETFVGSLTAPTSTEAVGEEEGGITGVFLPRNISDLAADRERGELVYFASSLAGTQGFRAEVDGRGAVRLFSHPLRELLLTSVHGERALVTTKPSDITPGHVFILATKTGSLSWEFGGNDGLTAIANTSLDTILYSNSGELYIYDEDSRSDHPLDLRGIPEKCVFSTNGDLYCGLSQTVRTQNTLDLWYQGVLTFRDAIWKIDTETGRTELIVSPEDYGVSLDVIHPNIDTDGMYMIITNKNDLTLWMVSLYDDRGTASEEAAGGGV